MGGFLTIEVDSKQSVRSIQICDDVHRDVNCNLKIEVFGIPGNQQGLGNHRG